jgi:hypothetical protein
VRAPGLGDADGAGLVGDGERSVSLGVGVGVRRTGVGTGETMTGTEVVTAGSTGSGRTPR